MTTTGKTYKGYEFRSMPKAPARTPGDPTNELLNKMRNALIARSTTPFVGVTVDGTPRRDLFSSRQAGASIQPMLDTVHAFLAQLTPAQTSAVMFPIDAHEWRQWSNPYPNTARHGLLLEDLTTQQRDAALALVRACMSAPGFDAARNMMRVNENLAEITGRWEDFGEWLYWISIMGRPSHDQPWGWQLDGHHLNINFFVFGDQVILSPVFMGAEPLKIETGKYANDGIEVFRDEGVRALDFVRSLNGQQRSKAILFPSALPKDLPPERVHGFDNHICAGAMNDNIVLPYEGVAFEELSKPQRERLLELTEVYVGQLNPDHARIKMNEIQRHGELRFAWIGGTGDDAVFYYRIHSPTVLIEFDHHPGWAFVHDDPYKMHVHTMVRTPNGGDYGKALLRG